MQPVFLRMENPSRTSSTRIMILLPPYDSVFENRQQGEQEQRREMA